MSADKLAEPGAGRLQNLMDEVREMQNDIEKIHARVVRLGLHGTASHLEGAVEGLRSAWMSLRGALHRGKS